MSFAAWDRLLLLEERFAGELSSAIDAAVGEPPDPTRIRDVLVQRRLLSIHSFTWMMDNLICALDGDDAREVATGILRDEYAGPNHRFEFLKEIEALGHSRRDILECPPTPTTREAIKRIIRYTVSLTKASELRRLVFLRFFAEVLPGNEFAQIFDHALSIKLLSAERSRFLWPHIQFDVLGHEQLSHAEQYQHLILGELNGETDESEAAEVMRWCCDLRLAFYGQFQQS